MVIELKSIVENNELLISILNDVDEDCFPKKGTGIGLRNIRERLFLIYGKRDLMTTRREKDKYVVLLTIPQLNTV